MKIKQGNKENNNRVDKPKPTPSDDDEKRRHVRAELPTMVTMKVFSREGREKKAITLKGIIDDLSIGGVSVEVDERYMPIDVDQLVEQIVKMEIHFPKNKKNPYILGSIRWIKREVAKGSSVLQLGIQFVDITEENLKALKNFLELGSGDQNLLWNLWDSAFL